MTCGMLNPVPHGSPGNMGGEGISAGLEGEYALDACSLLIASRASRSRASFALSPTDMYVSENPEDTAILLPEYVLTELSLS